MADQELMEKIQMLMAQVGESVKELADRGIDSNIMVYNNGRVDMTFSKTEDITPGVVRKKAKS